MEGIGILGVGRLGSALAARLGGAIRLLVCDLDHTVAAAVAEATGASACEPTALIRQCDVVFVCVPPEQVLRTLSALASIGGGPSGQIFVNTCTSIPTYELCDDPALAGITVVGLKPVCQFTALAKGIPAVFVTSAADRLALFDSLIGDLGTVILGSEDQVGDVNQMATRAALSACVKLRSSLLNITDDTRIIDSAIRNVFAGTALDFPPDPANGYTSAILRSITVPTDEPERVQINDGAQFWLSVNGDGSC